MEVAKDEALMPCRAHVALKFFLEPALAFLGKRHQLLGDFVTSPFLKPPGEELPLPQGHMPWPCPLCFSYT